MRSLKKVTEDSANTEKGGDMLRSRGYHGVLLANISEFMDKLQGFNEDCVILTGSLTLTMRYNPDSVEYQRIRELLDIILELTPGLVGIRRPDMAELENIVINFREGVIDAKIELGERHS